MAHLQFARDGRAGFSVNGSNPVDAFSAAAAGAATSARATFSRPPWWARVVGWAKTRPPRRTAK